VITPPGPVKFLLVDDLEENITALEALLQRPGLELLKARSGTEALELLLKHEVALALLDVQMPGMDGFELAELMRGTERTRRIPIIFVTAGGKDNQRLFRGYDTGAVDFLFKPIDPHVLRSKADVFYELDRQKQEVARLLEESKRNAEAMHRRGQELHIMADSMPQLVFTCRPDGYADFFNRRWHEYTGLSMEASFGDGWMSSADPQDLPAVQARWARSVESGEDYELEYRVRRRDGEYRWFLARAFPWRDEGGEVVRWFGTCTDIHEQKMVAEFEQQLLGIVSHDLRNPLNAILLTAGALLRRDGLDERTEKQLARISSSADRATRLVHDLLDLTKARLGGGISLTPRATDLHAVVRAVVQELEAANPGRVLKLTQRGPAQGVWDPDRLAQVASNLISNALRYSDGGSAVEVETRGLDGGVQLRVHNLGQPIDPERLPLVFEPYQRGVDSADGGTRSIGLGLYITRHIVEAHHGAIEVSSTLEEGTTFTVTLPIPAPRAWANSAAAQEADAGDAREATPPAY
jgi:sigma-B regulation protein RsbU (phosphoserine phosphatase)